MSGESPAVVDMNSDVHPAVVSYRLAQVELSLTTINNKLDLIAQNYPTNKTIEMYLQPIRDELTELKKEKKEEEKAKAALASQLKLALMVAVASPLFSIIITILLREPQ